jgi:hypothetical protein
MAHPLKDFARAVQDATGWPYTKALGFVQANILTAREGTEEIADHRVRRETVTTKLIDQATAPTPAPA